MDLTPRCKSAIDNARSVSVRVGDPHLSSAHLVLGLLSVTGGAAEALHRAGLTVTHVEQYLQTHRARPERTIEKRGSVVANSAFKTIVQAESHAADTQRHYIGTEHVLLALLDEQSGEACDLFDAHKIDRESMRAALFGLFKSPGSVTAE